MQPPIIMILYATDSYIFGLCLSQVFFALRACITVPQPGGSKLKSLLKSKCLVLFVFQNFIPIVLENNDSMPLFHAHSIQAEISLLQVLSFVQSKPAGTLYGSQ